MSDAAKAAAEKTAKAQPAPDAEPGEDVAARTANSTTTVDPATGTRTTQLSPQAVNFRDDAGAWQPVDNTLIPADQKAGGPAGGGADTGWANSAAGYDATLPKDLTAPVTLTDGANAGQWVSLQLNPATAPAAAPAASKSASSATGTARTLAAATVATAAGEAPDVAPVAGEVDGATVAYADVLPGTDVALQAQGSGVKETITLDSPNAAALAAGALSYTVKTGPGLKLTEADDTVTVTNAKGATVFTLPAPFMDDAKGAHSDNIDVTLTPGAVGADGVGQTTLTVTPDASWLKAADRAWPVVIDPTIQYPASILGCGISSSAATTTSCSNGSQIPLSWNSSTGAQQRGLLRFPTLLDVIPADAQIAQAKLRVKTAAVAGGGTTSVDAKELTAGFAAGATWNTRDGSTAWASAGGDRGAAIARASINTATAGELSFDVADAVQRWSEGTTANYTGFELEKTAAASGGAPVNLTKPDDASLLIEWNPRGGDRKANEVITEDLSDATSVSVNPATGNAMVTTQQLSIAGVGLDLNLAHTSNSLGTAALGTNGARWRNSLSGVSLQPYTGSMFYTDATGAAWTYYKALDGSWIRPTGLDADLVANADGTFTLTERQSKVAQKFLNIGTSADPSYGLSTVTDRNGNTITFTYDASARLPYNDRLILRKVTDTRGRDLTLTNFGYWDSWVTDVTNREPSTTVANNQLASETNSAGGTTSYEYDASDRVTAIVVPEGQRTELTYDSTGRVLTLKRIANNGQNPTWTFVYGTFDRATGQALTKTTVTDPNGHASEYTSDGRGRVGAHTNALGKKVLDTFTANDDGETSTGATPGAAGGTTTQKSVNEFSGGTGAAASAATWNLTSSRLPTGAGIANTYGTGARLYDVTSSTDARGNTTNYAYDNAGNQTSVTSGGVTTKNLYQGNTDPDYGGTVNCGPTVNNAVTATKAGVLCETRDGAYVKGSTAAATTAHRVAYRYNAKGELVTLLPGTPSAQQQQTFEYDDLSRLTSTTDGRGQTTFYGYDSADRLTYTLYQDGRVVSHYFGDESGNGWLRAIDEYPANSSTADRHVDYAKDDLGRLRATVAPEATTNLDYDSAGNLIQYVDAGGTVNYGYNAADQLTSLALPGGSCTGQTLASPGAASTKCVLFGLDDDGRRTSTRYPGGQTLAATLDDSGRIQRTVGTTRTSGGTATTRLDLAYTWTDTNAPSQPNNPNKDTSLVSSVTDAIAAAKTTYSHDGLDRLTAASTAPTAGGAVTRYEGFCYDGAGNRTKYLNSTSTTCSSGTAAATFTYNGGNELTAATGVTPTGAALAGTGFTYDGNGNQTSAKSQIGLATAYNAQEGASSFTPAGGAAIAQAYAAGDGGNGERIRSGSGAGATSFAVSPLSPAPAWSTTGTGPSAQSTWTVRDPSGGLIAVRIGTSATSATEYYPFTDNVGSVRAMVKADGTLANSYSYSAYGTTLTANEATGASQPYRYAGGYTDTATGLIKLGVRYYDPAQGRFTQQDPTGQDPYAYLYAVGAPESFADPTGAIVPAVAAGLLLAARAAPAVARVAPAAGRAAKGIKKAFSYRSVTRPMSPSKEVAEQGARREAANGGPRCVYRPQDCGKGKLPHAHVDYYNNKGEVLQTSHYNYPLR
ncbi:RHS repeat-associated core domain-containing protein [Kineococcus aurantiacus]|uniref:RHS repeat-associated protein n=1 Tax=Kineococcus aurantiacus TaxID=37633 RepID=A0A7Y9J397_9ACTN|nr:RHS repeat-associated core domain-containing protein [Kineococcus aurantiacus]NYD25014.1 RHS repeat-associated protein [Kineococcus aurantiacus]